MARYGPRGLKYNPTAVALITEAIALGAHRTHAAGYAGITLATLLNWEDRYPEFRAAMEEAEGRGVVGWLAKMEIAANNGDWRAAWEKLKSIHPELYGRTVSDQRHSGPDGKEPVKVTHGISLDQLSDADLALLERLARLRAGPGGDSGDPGTP